MNNFKLYSHPSKDVYENIRPIQSVDFINFNSAINESYLDVLVADRVGNELLLEGAMNNMSNESLMILNEGVIGAIYDSIVKLIKSIISFIKGIIDKLNLFVDSMNSNVNRWLKEVAPVALEKSKNPNYTNRLEYEGYKWNEAFISDGVFSSMEKILELKVKIKTADVDNVTGDIAETTAEVKASPEDAAKFIDSEKNKLKTVSSHTKKKKKEISKSEKEPEKDDSKKDSKEEMKIDIPKVKPDEDSEKNDNNQNTKSGGDTSKSTVDEYLNREFSSNINNYEEAIIRKAHGTKEPLTLNRFNSSTIKAHIDFISKSSNIVAKIQNSYTSLLEGYDKLEAAIESVSNDTSLSDDDDSGKYLKETVRDSISFIRKCTAITNTLCRLNIRLVEDCTKEYIKICNKLALMKKE